jgi:hypothetical protein
MNLQAVSVGVVNAINPQTQVVWLQSTGYATAGTGHRMPTYNTAVTLAAQIQPLPTRELEHMDSLNIQGTLRSLYITGESASAIRGGREGGDLFQFADPVVFGSVVATWLCVSVEETWSNWSKAVVQLQNGR